MLGISTGPFLDYISKTAPSDTEGGADAEQCTDICPDLDEEWRAPRLAAIWGGVVAINAFGVGITLLCQVSGAGLAKFMLAWPHQVFYLRSK